MVQNVYGYGYTDLPASSKAYVSESESKKFVVLEASGWNQQHKGSGARVASDGAGGNFRYAITGSESQIVTVEVPPGKSCQGEPGSMMYLSSAIRMKVGCAGDCLGRACGGEDCCFLDFANHTDRIGYAALTTNQPLAKVIPVDLASPEVGNTLIVQQGTYMASYGEVNIGFDCDCNLFRCCCGGMVSGVAWCGVAWCGVAWLQSKEIIHSERLPSFEFVPVFSYHIACFYYYYSFALQSIPI